MAWRGTFLQYFRKLRRKYVLISNILIFLYKFCSQNFTFFPTKTRVQSKAKLYEMCVVRWHWYRFFSSEYYRFPLSV